MQAVEGDSAQLKKFQTQLASIDDKLALYQHDVKKINTRMNELRNERQCVAKKIKQLKQGLIVTEHALLRYLERVMGIDLNEVREKILPSDVRKLAENFGDGTYPVSTHKVKVQDGVVTTIIL